MLAYVGPEYDAFRGDLVAWEEAAVVSLRATDGSGAAVSRSTRQVEQSAGGSSTASGRGRSVRVRGGRGRGGHTGRGDLDDSVRRRSDSELSDIPDNLSDMVID